MAKLKDVLAQATVEVKDGDVLAANTDKVGYLPTFKENTELQLGNYSFRIVGIGEPDVETGKHVAFKIVPIVLNEDHNAYVDGDLPIAYLEAGKVIHLLGRNNPDFKDPYQDRQYHVIEGIAAGEEHRQLLLGFLSFVNSEYSLGVNDFQLEEPDYTGA